MKSEDSIDDAELAERQQIADVINSVKEEKQVEEKEETRMNSFLATPEASDYQVPQISHQDLIEGVKKEQKVSKTQAKVDQILSNFSMRYKYEDLLREEMTLPLPQSYKLLLNLFTQLDVSINFLKFRRQAPRIT